MGWFVGCGAAEVPPPATDQDFAFIQEREATIDRNAGPAAGSDCDAACPAQRALCEAAQEICIIADDTADLDVIERCRDADRTCRQGRSCACDGP
ncbi:MAG: hypothetical protein AAGF12_04315 [Myxococcota bacterium]